MLKLSNLTFATYVYHTIIGLYLTPIFLREPYKRIEHITSLLFFLLLHDFQRQ